MKWSPGHIRWFAFGLAVVLSLPFLPAPLAGLYLWGSPYLMLNAVFSGKNLVWLNLIGLFLLVVILFRRRWICKYACPSGAVCDLVSERGRKHNRAWRFPVNKSLAIAALLLALFNVPVLMVIDPFNLFYMGFEWTRTGIGLPALIKLSGLVFLILFSLLFPNVWCARVCPLGGLQLLLADLKSTFSHRTPKKIGPEGRRMFLAGSAGILGGILLPGVWPDRKTRFIRPPYALPEEELTTTCIRCGSCTAACPTGIIRPSVDVKHPERLLTPEVDFSTAYCLPGCTDCGTVCPSGAIRKFTVREKREHVMGIARIDPARCYLQEGRECNQCRQSCAYDAIAMRADNSLSPDLPRIIESRCVGCGACQVVCPPRVIRIEPVPL